jgi:16S rRNA (adenine1518-N6/adenine1519-N6)-dimethyltransferase
MTERSDDLPASRPGDETDDPRQLLKRYGFAPKKSYSQSFLISRRAVSVIVDALELTGSETVVELGAGLGTLTRPLLSRARTVIAVERDPDMLHVLESELSELGLTIVRGDAARVDYETLAEPPLCVVGNLPYAITGAILEHLVHHAAHVSRAVLMVQREVRDRLVASPGSREYGALTVFTSAAFRIETVLKLPPSAFHPQPKVHSAVVRFLPHAVPRAQETQAFRRVVRAAFGQRRKTLLNALGAVVGKELARAGILRAGFDPQQRGETLSVEELASLTRALDDES